MGVSGMGTTFIQTVNISDMNIENGGEVNYTIKVDKQDASDSIYMHITGKDGSTVKFAGTDVLSAAGVNTGYAAYTGGFDFADSLTTLVIEVGGRDINLAIGPVFDDVTINVIYNVISQIIQQTITTVEQYVYLNSDATQEELDIVEDIFDNNMPVEQPDGGFDLEPIDDGGTDETSYETVELELELDLEIDFEMEFEMSDMEMDLDMPDIEMEAPVTTVEVEMEMEVETPVEEIEVAAVKSEPEPVEEPVEEQPEPKEEVKEEPKEEVKEEPKEEIKKEVKEEPKKEIKVAPKKEIKPKTKQQKKEDKQKAGTKIVKKMGDKGRYDSTNQLKTLIVMNVIADTKSFFSAQKLQQDIPGFFSSATVPDAVLSDNNIAAYLLMVGSSQKMNSLINSQYE